MPLNLEDKKVLVAEVTEVAKTALSVVAAEYRGLTVTQMTDLRSKARAQGVYMRVVKNTLARRAAEGTSYACLQDAMVGPLAYAISTDPVAVAKLLSEFAKDNEQLKIKAAAMSGKLMSLDQVRALATLPGREQLLAMLLGTMQAPIANFVRTLNEVPSKFVRTLAAVRDAKQAA